MSETRTFFLVGEYGEYGGARTYFEGLVTFLLKEGCNLTVFHPKGIPPRLGKIPENASLELEPIEFSLDNKAFKFLPRRFLRNPVTYAWEAKLIGEHLDEKARNHQVCVVYSVSSPGRFLGKTERKLQSIQIHHTYPRGILHRISGPIFGHRVKRQNVKLIGVSAFLAQRLNRSWNLSHEFEAQTVTNKAGIGSTPTSDKSKDSSTVLSVGVVNREKAPENFISVANSFFSKYPDFDVRFVWVGGGEGLERARQKVTQLGLEEKICFVGHRNQVEPFYKQAAVYMQLSRVDSMPIAAIDALHCGVPMLVTRVGGLPELLPVSLRKTCIWEPTGPFDEDLVHKLLTDEEFRKAIVATLNQHYEESFSAMRWEGQMKKALFC